MRLIRLDNLQEGMEAGSDLYDEHNRLMLRRGATIRSTYMSRFRDMGLPALYVQDSDTADIQVPQVIPPADRIKAMNNLSSTFDAISKATEEFRQMSLEAAHQNIQAKKFVDNFKTITRDQAIDAMVGDVNTLVDQLMNRDVIVGLNSIKTHDGYTFQHSIDVAIMGLLLAKKLGWSKERLRDFGIGCLLHDMGKIFIDTLILNKPGRLDEGEFERMRAHPTLGFELVKTITPTMSQLIPHVAYQHHERQDGSGYPRGLEGDNTLGENNPNTIHDFGSVAAAADIYDAMASDRPYRHGWPPDRVVSFIRDLSGSHLNSKVVEIFLNTVAPYPIGTGVRVLNGPLEGCEGVVADVDERVLDRPKIRVLFDPDGTRITAEEVDLKEEEEVMVESVRDGEPDMEPLGSSKATGQGGGGSGGGGEIACPACGAISTGKFCPECGQNLIPDDE